MRHCLRMLWKDQAGFVHSLDALLFGTILIIGSIVGLVTLRDQIVQELGDVGAALGNLNHSYEVSEFEDDEFGVVAPGYSFQDFSDSCEEGDEEGADNGDAANSPPGCMDVGVAPTNESAGN